MRSARFLLVSLLTLAGCGSGATEPPTQEPARALADDVPPEKDLLKLFKGVPAVNKKGKLTAAFGKGTYAIEEHTPTLFRFRYQIKGWIIVKGMIDRDLDVSIRWMPDSERSDRPFRMKFEGKKEGEDVVWTARVQITPGHIDGTWDRASGGGTLRYPFRSTDKGFLMTIERFEHTFGPPED
jgi:hypothetical protein